MGTVTDLVKRQVHAFHQGKVGISQLAPRFADKGLLVHGAPVFSHAPCMQQVEGLHAHNVQGR